MIDSVLEQKKEDYELIRAGKYEIQYKNITSPKSEAWHSPCHISQGRAMSQKTLLLLLLRVQATY